MRENLKNRRQIKYLDRMMTLWGSLAREFSRSLTIASYFGAKILLLF